MSMGLAKAALEAAVRYIAAEVGPRGIRVHAISPGPLATRAASGIPEFDELLDRAQRKAPARQLISIDDVGAATAFLALDGAKLITGDVMYIDGGYHIIDLDRPCPLFKYAGSRTTHPVIRVPHVENICGSSAESQCTVQWKVDDPWVPRIVKTQRTQTAR